MKVAIANAEIIDGQKDKNIEAVDRLMAQSSRLGAEYLFLGEAVIQGFNGLTWEYEKDYHKESISLESPSMHELKELCRRHTIALGVGYYEGYREKLYASYVLIDAHGEILMNYRRMSKGWKEEGFDHPNYCQGDELLCSHLGEATCTFSICGDMWTDHIVQRLKNHASDTIIWPLFIDYSIDEWESEAKNEYLEQVKSIGKRTLLINSISRAGDHANGGLLDIAADGSINSEAKMLESPILMVEL